MLKRTFKLRSSASSHGYFIVLGALVFASQTTYSFGLAPSNNSLGRTNIFVLTSTRYGRFVHFMTKSLSYMSLSIMYLIQASISATSVPGRIGSQTSARAASGVRRGSITTERAPRARKSARARPPPAGQLYDGSVPQQTKDFIGVLGT